MSELYLKLLVLESKVRKMQKAKKIKRKRVEELHEEFVSILSLLPGKEALNLESRNQHQTSR